MKPLLTALALALAAATADAQWLADAVASVGGQVQQQTAAVQRDAFIVSQLVAAVGELEDFQRNAALDKALDHVKSASKRASERPPAPAATHEMLASVAAAVQHAQQQGATADIPALEREILQRMHPLQQMLFREVDELRKTRQMLVDAQAKLATIAGDADGAMTAALGATFEFFRAGGD